MDSWQGFAEKPLTLNKYLYADANPVLFVDPSGLFSSSLIEISYVQSATTDSLMLGLAIMTVSLSDWHKREMSKLTDWARVKPFPIARKDKTRVLYLPGSMIDVYPDYVAAAAAHKLIKTKPIRSGTARELYKRTYGPIPPGMDVDHRIMLQHGGSDLDPRNLRLVESEINQLQGVMAYWLNVFDPYGTVYSSVELIGW